MTEKEIFKHTILVDRIDEKLRDDIKDIIIKSVLEIRDKNIDYNYDINELLTYFSNMIRIMIEVIEVIEFGDDNNEK